jgi:hypothetical protein
MGGRKTFVTNTVLTAADVQDYLMDQSVMVFSNSTTRGSAIPTPTEGMVTYLTGTDSLEAYNGANWLSAAGVSSGNAIINGAFEINQRNFTSSTAGNIYNFDRWRQDRDGGTVTISSQAFTLGTAPVAGYEAANFLRTVVAGQSATGHYAVVSQRIEGVRNFAGQTVTISFFAKAASGSPKIGVGVSQGFGTGGSPSAAADAGAGAITISTSWARYSLTYAVPSISGKTLGTNLDSYLSIEFWFSAGSTYATRASSIGIQNNTFDIWGIQVEAGSVANPFRINANSLQGELAACQRYYEKSYSLLVAPGTSTNIDRTQIPAYTFTTIFGNYTVPFKVPKRATPAMVLWAIDGTVNRVTMVKDDVKTNANTLANAIGQNSFNGWVASGNTSTTTDTPTTFHWAAEAEL